MYSNLYLWLYPPYRFLDFFDWSVSNIIMQTKEINLDSVVRSCYNKFSYPFKRTWVLSFSRWKMRLNHKHNFCFYFSSGGGDREALSGVIRQRLQVQYHPQLQWRSVWPLPPADSVPGVRMHRCGERQVPFRYKVQSAQLSINLLFVCVTPLIMHTLLRCRGQRSASISSPSDGIESAEGLTFWSYSWNWEMICSDSISSLSHCCLMQLNYFPL